MAKRKPKLTPTTAMKEFRKRARSILWRQDGQEKKTYKRFEELVTSFTQGGMTPDQAIVQAAKDFDCLKRLFREYDVSDYDPHPGSHPDTPRPPEEKDVPTVRCENKELSYRENLGWALTAAGEYLRKATTPKVCPNDQAYYLYIQAIEQPKDFMQRLGQVEAKSDSIQEEQRLARKSSKLTIEEIDEMLTMLEAD